MKIITIQEGQTNTYENIELMFQGLSEKGLIISVLEDGLIKGVIDGKEVSIEFGNFSIENTKANTIKDISVYRDTVRASVTLLKKQGLIEKSQLEKLAAQFSFLNENSKEVKKEKEVEVKAPAEDIKKEK